MGGIRGKSARKRAKMAQNSKTFDRISGRFYDEKVAMPSGKVNEDVMLSAPKSFKRFLAAKAAAESRSKRRDRVEDDDSEEEEPAAAKERGKEKVDDVGEESSEDDRGEATNRNISGEGALTSVAPLVRAQPDKGNATLRAMDEKAATAAREAEAEAKKKKKKHLSLRERKKRDRAALRAQKEEEAEFLRGGGNTVRFGEVAEAPPTITLKRKSGGKGEKEVPIAQSGHKIVEIAENQTGGKSNRQSKIFADLLSAAKGSSAKSKKKSETQGLKRTADLAALRAQVISDYRSMKGRPMNNGRNVKLASNPTKLFQSGAGSLQGVGGISAAQLRKDRR